MNARVLLATLAGGVVTFLLGWLIFGILAADYYKANTNHYGGLEKENPELIGIFAANVLFSFVLAYVFDKWANIKTFVSGAIAAVIIYIPILAAYNIYFWAFMNLMGKKVLIVDVVLNAVIMAIAGGVVAIVLGFKKAA